MTKRGDEVEQAVTAVNSAGAVALFIAPQVSPPENYLLEGDAVTVVIAGGGRTGPYRLGAIALGCLRRRPDDILLVVEQSGEEVVRETEVSAAGRNRPPTPRGDRRSP